MSKHQLRCAVPKATVNPVERAQLVAALWMRPVVSDTEAAAMVGLPRSTWAALKRMAHFPKQFRLGRRVFFRVEDLRAWLDAKALATREEPRAWVSHKQGVCTSTAAATPPSFRNSRQMKGEIL